MFGRLAGALSFTKGPLVDSVLDTSSLSQIGNLGPVFVGIRTGTEGTAGAVGRWVVLGGRSRGVLCREGVVFAVILHVARVGWLIIGERKGDVESCDKGGETRMACGLWCVCATHSKESF